MNCLFNYFQNVTGLLVFHFSFNVSLLRFFFFFHTSKVHSFFFYFLYCAFDITHQLSFFDLPMLLFATIEKSSPSFYKSSKILTAIQNIHVKQNNAFSFKFLPKAD